jgi:hypothetical protein
VSEHCSVITIGSIVSRLTTTGAYAQDDTIEWALRGRKKGFVQLVQT